MIFIGAAWGAWLVSMSLRQFAARCLNGSDRADRVYWWFRRRSEGPADELRSAK